MISCLSEVLCLFTEEYDGFLSSLCANSNLITDLLYLSSDVPAEYISNDCPDKETLGNAYDWLLDVTQKNFRARKSGQERHEADIPNWINEDVALKIISNFASFNFASEKPPQKTDYQCAALLGSTVPNMEKRMHYFVDQLENNNLYVENLFLLTGKRLVDSTKYYDGSEEYLNTVSIKNNVDFSKLSEEHLIQDVHDRVCKKSFSCASIKTVLVYAEKESGRASTIDTLVEFSKYLKDCKNTIYISIAPFIIYQNELIARFSLNQFFHYYETIGQAADISNVPNLLKAGHYLVMSFAEALYASQYRIKANIQKKEFPNNQKTEL